MTAEAEVGVAERFDFDPLAYEQPFSIILGTDAPIGLAGGGYKWPATLEAQMVGKTGEAAEPFRKEFSFPIVGNDLYGQFLNQKAKAGDVFRVVYMAKAGGGVRAFAIKTYESVAKIDDKLTALSKRLDGALEEVASVQAALTAREGELSAMRGELETIRKQMAGRQQTKAEAGEVAARRNRIRKGFAVTGLPDNDHVAVLSKLLGRKVGLDGIDDLSELARVYNATLRVHKGETDWDAVLNRTATQKAA